MGDRTNRRFMPADGHPRSAARRRQQPDLRRLADGALRNQDAAGIRRNADDAGIAALAGRQQAAFARSALIAVAVMPGHASPHYDTLPTRDRRTTEGTTQMPKLVVYNSM